jgi:hypothetical protein
VDFCSVTALSYSIDRPSLSLYYLLCLSNIVGSGIKLAVAVRSLRSIPQLGESLSHISSIGSASIARVNWVARLYSHCILWWFYYALQNYCAHCYTVLFLFPMWTTLFVMLIHRLSYKSLNGFNFDNSITEKWRPAEDGNCGFTEREEIFSKTEVEVEFSLIS